MRIQANLREQMLAWVQTCLPEEACGLLGGRDGEAVLLVAVENELHSPVRFRMRPEEQLSGLRQMEAQGLDLLAIFHSHPTGPAVPSARDIAEAFYPEALMLIWSPGANGWSLRGFWIEAGCAREEMTLE
jgi:proteasome lid subunit RPN8/RPN11